MNWGTVGGRMRTKRARARAASVCLALSMWNSNNAPAQHRAWWRWPRTDIRRQAHRVEEGADEQLALAGVCSLCAAAALCCL